MLGTLIGMIVAAVAVRVFIAGLEAARTRKLAVLGFFPAGFSFGAFAWTAFDPSAEFTARVAQALGAISAGLAHAVTFSVVALPARRVWMRMVLVPLGIWTGTFAAFWFVMPASTTTLDVALLVLGSATVTSWVMMPFWARNRGFVQHGSRRFPSVRFACPRCGTHVDWGQGIAACTDCGLFIHLLWPADELQARGEGSGAAIRRHSRSVEFPCPACSARVEWIQGDNTCQACGLKLSMHWNVHGKGS